MPVSNPDDDLLLIRCPSCGQRFKVGDDLRGRTVECGGCDHRFRINDDVIVRGRKFYPGERRNTRLSHFQRVPLAVVPPVIGTATIRYAEPPDPAKIEPASPQRILAGVLGGLIIVAIALILIMGSARGGVLDGITTMNRMIIACFSGLLGTVLLVYANPRGRVKAMATGVALIAGLMTLPMIFTSGSTSLPSPDVDTRITSQQTEDTSASTTETEEITELRRLIGTNPLVAEIDRLAASGSPLTAVGLWLKDMREHNRFLIKDYILRTTGADLQSHFYPRDQGNFLMVVTGISLTLDQMAAIASELGTVENSYPELSVVEVKVNNQNFIEGPIEKLTDRNNPAFYDLNKRELESIDLERVERAVKRLTDAPPTIYRSDITRKLITLLDTPGVEFKGDICRAITVWAEDHQQASAVALKQAEDMMTNRVTIPEELISLIVKTKNPGVLPILKELWQQNPNQWESFIAAVGAPAEATVIELFISANGSHRHSAVRLLGQVGSVKSLRVLSEAKAGNDSELRVLMDKAIGAINARQAQ